MIKQLEDKTPQTGGAAFIASNATLAGDVTLMEGSSVWYGAVLRGDLDSITVGKNSNVQDNATLHGDRGYPITLGEGVSIGHNAVVHGATVGDNTVIGMNAVLLNGAVIGKNCIVGETLEHCNPGEWKISVIAPNYNLPENSVIGANEMIG